MTIITEIKVLITDIILPWLTIAIPFCTLGLFLSPGHHTILGAIALYLNQLTIVS